MQLSSRTQTPQSTLKSRIRTQAKNQGTYFVMLLARVQLLVSVAEMHEHLPKNQWGLEAPDPPTPLSLHQRCHPTACFGACGSTHKSVNILPDATTYCHPASPFFK